MASTYSSLKIQLMSTGENTTTWGDVTNVNLGTALEEAIVGSADVTFASANVTLTLTDTNASQTARNMRLRCTGTTGGSTRNLVVPTIEKPYLIKNDCADSVVVKTAAGSGITVPAGAAMWLYVDGTNVVSATTYLTSLTLGSALPVASGGTALTSYNSGGAVYASSSSALTSGTLPTTAGGTGLTTFTSGGAVYASSTSALTTGTLPAASGGTGYTSYTDGQLLIGNSSGGGLSKATITAGSGITVTNGNGSITIATAGSGGTVTSVNASGGTTGLSFSGGPITTSGTLTLSGTLAVANGGTGLTSYTSGGAVYASSSSALTSGTLPITAGGTGSATVAGARTTLVPAGSMAYVASGTATNSGKISWGTSAPGTLALGEIYFKYS